MNASGGEDRPEEETGQSAPVDLIDFYRRWPEFRSMAARLAERPDLSHPERQTMRWLILLTDRISERDLQPLVRR